MSKRLLDERYERDQSEALAEALGITTDELAQTVYEIHTNESDEGLIYEYYVEFSDDSPIEILNKINGLSVNLAVSLGPNGLE